MIIDQTDPPPLIDLADLKTRVDLIEVAQALRLEGLKKSGSSYVARWAGGWEASWRRSPPARPSATTSAPSCRRRPPRARPWLTSPRCVTKSVTNLPTATETSAGPPCGRW